MSNLNCPFYQKKCILKPQANLPLFKEEHNCGGLLNKCSFFIKEKIKQVKSDVPVKIIIKQVNNIYMVKADAVAYPANNLLEIDDSILNRMTFNKAQLQCNALFKKGIKMGYVYIVQAENQWKIKQKYIFNMVVAGESRLVNESDVSSAIKKSLLMADQMGLENILIMPCDNGTHDVSLISLTQLSAMYMIMQSHKFQSLKTIFICMEDQETEEIFIEYYNRIFGNKDEPSNKSNASVTS